MLDFLTCGESHGRMLSAVLEGMPAGLLLEPRDIDSDLERRQKGYGRGSRSTCIEKDKIEIISGVRWGKTTGSPIGLIINNKDWENRKKEMSIYEKDFNKNDFISVPRPGHADLAGMIKYDILDAKPILERASARNTAVVTAIGAVCKKYLQEFGIEVIGYVRSIADVDAGLFPIHNIAKFRKKVETSIVRCPDKNLSNNMAVRIDKAKKQGDTLGGIVCIDVINVPAGLGSYTQWDKRLDALLAQCLMSIPSVKTVSIGDDSVSKRYGSHTHDTIIYNKKNGYHHTSNHAGGIEGGISNGEPIRSCISLKPIPTLGKPLDTIDVRTKKISKAAVVRSDVCVVPSAVVVAEAMAAFAIARAHREKFGGDNIRDIKKNVDTYQKRVKSM
ncbi:chorismate synthase [bacterium]